MLPNYIVLLSANKYFNFLSGTNEIYGNLKECQKKVLKI